MASFAPELPHDELSSHHKEYQVAERVSQKRPHADLIFEIENVGKRYRGPVDDESKRESPVEDSLIAPVLWVAAFCADKALGGANALIQERS
jgi:hypothetical protein